MKSFRLRVYQDFRKKHHQTILRDEAVQMKILQDREARKRKVRKPYTRH